MTRFSKYSSTLTLLARELRELIRLYVIRFFFARVFSRRCITLYASSTRNDDLSLNNPTTRAPTNRTPNQSSQATTCSTTLHTNLHTKNTLTAKHTHRLTNIIKTLYYDFSYLTMRFRFFRMACRVCVRVSLSLSSNCLPKIQWQQVMLLGDSGVGKTCLLVRFRDGTFLSGNFISTVGIDFRVRDAGAADDMLPHYRACCCIRIVIVCICECCESFATKMKYVSVSLPLPLSRSSHIVVVVVRPFPP